MAVCEACGNDYYLAFEVIAAGNRHVSEKLYFSASRRRSQSVLAHL